MSGPYAGYQGRGAVVAAQLAVEHFGRKVRGRAIEVIAGDYQNKPGASVGSALAGALVVLRTEPTLRWHSTGYASGTLASSAHEIR